MSHHLPFAITLEYTEDLLGTLRHDFNLSPTEESHANKLMQANLPPLVRAEILPYLFGVSHGLILSMSRFPAHYYRSYTIRKKDGGTRTIEAPRRFMKLIQRWINTHILSKAELSSLVMGFVPNKNMFSNAKEHLISRNVMVVDIQDFFPSVRKQQVKRIFRNFGYPPRVANYLAGLCTLHKRLPQGAPTSPTLANIAFSPVDTLLELLAREWECKYTRYADDLAFSGDRFFTREDINRVEKTLAGSGFEINHEKSRIMGSGARQILAGLIVNKSGLPLRVKRRRWRAIFHQANLHPERYIEKSSQLRGIAAFVNEYNSALAQKYQTIVNKIVNFQ
jgi:retron-type reverse transcriptase